MNISAKVLKQTPLAEGGEGIIYDLGDNVLKVYKDSVNKQEKLKKIKLLMTKSLPLNIIKPIDIAYDSQKKFIGYIMTKAEGEDVKKLGNKKYVKVNNIKIQDISKLALKIKETLTILHNQNILISDLNDSNILFTKDFEPYFIDVDSWSIDNVNCTVCMETFKDPKLVSSNFTKDTDSFSFAVLLFKMLTRLHPFGGTMNPDMDIIQRMSKGISVIENSKVIVPKNINKWEFMSPSLLTDMKSIFEQGKRFLIDQNLLDFVSNLKYCDKHEDYYYSKYKTCPICDGNAVIIQTPVQVVANGFIPYIVLIASNGIKMVLGVDTFIDDNDFVVHSRSKKKVKLINSNRYYFSNNGEITFTVSNTDIGVSNHKGTFIFEKINKSNVVVKDDIVYYINSSCNLVELTVGDIGNSLRVITKTSFNSFFEVHDKDNYLVCNVYDGFKIVNISGYNYQINDNDKIMGYGIHFDETKKRWLFITEDDKGNFKTLIFDKNKVVYISDSIRYQTDLSNLCFSGGVIFSPSDKVIRGFGYEKNVYKDFPCEVVNDGSKLIREGNKFIVINDKEVYKLG